MLSEAIPFFLARVDIDDLFGQEETQPDVGSGSLDDRTAVGSERQHFLRVREWKGTK